MARTARSSKLEGRTARASLPKKETPVWVRVGRGEYLGYAARTNQWRARVLRTGTKRYVKGTIGLADDLRDPDGVEVLDYFQASRKAIEWADARRREWTPVEAPLTVHDAAQNYLTWYRENRKAVTATEATIKAHILPELGDREIASLTTTDINAWRDSLARKKARKRTGRGRTQQHKRDAATREGQDEAKRARRATANRVLAVLRAILNRAFQDEKVPDNTAWRRVKPFPRVDLPRVRFLTEAEALRLVNGCAPDFRPIVRAALLTGARYGELVSMKVGDFNPSTSQVFIAPSKSGRPRYVPLNAAGVKLFNALTAGRASGAPMFAKGEAPWGKNHQQKPMLEACKQGKITPAVRFHELRHTYASALAQAGADLLTISKLLGHADTRITSRHYAHLCDRTLANAVQALLPSFGDAPAQKVTAIR